MKYTPRQRKLVLELLEDRNAPGVLFDVAPPFAPDGAVPKSSISLSEIQSSIDSLREISITDLDGFANVRSKSQFVAQPRIEPRRVDAASPLSFALTELNDVLNGSLFSPLFSQSSDEVYILTTTNNRTIKGEVFDRQSESHLNPVSRSVNEQEVQSYVSLKNSDALYSILSSSSLKSDSKSGEPTTNWVHTDNGNIRIDCTTNPASGGNPEGILGTDAKLGPGWFSNVNWSDDDNDGYPGSLPPDNDAAYTPDKVDNFVTGGDKDLRKFKVYVSAHNNLGGHNWSFKLTFGAKVAVYEQNTKAGVVPNNKIFVTGELTTEDAFTKSKTLWLEGQTASDTVMDVQLTVTHVGNIPMLSLTDVVNVTVFEADPWLYLFGGEGGTAQAQNDKNSVKHSTRSPGTNDKNGMISWDDANGDGTKGDVDTECEYFANAMEVAASVKPLTSANYLVNNNIRYQWERERWGKDWVYAKDQNNGQWSWGGNDETDKWYNDKQYGHGDEDTIPDPWIFDLDEPGTAVKSYEPNFFTKVAHFKNFKEQVQILIYGVFTACSRFAKWHSQMLLIPKPGGVMNELTRDVMSKQKLGMGWKPLPADPDAF